MEPQKLKQSKAAHLFHIEKMETKNLGKWPNVTKLVRVRAETEPWGSWATGHLGCC